MASPTYRVENGKLIVTIDVSAAALGKATPSASGKTLNVASSGGFIAVEGASKPIKLSFNVTTPIARG